jgi:hypothetical protein
MATETSSFDMLRHDGFGWWLSGLLDGEGSFNIYVHKHKDRNNMITCRCVMYLQLRIDDLSILRECMERTGIGKIRTRIPKRQNPVAEWSVVRKSDCIVLRDILSLYPLRSKKQQDFILWSEALEEWRKPCEERNWLRMAHLAKALHKSRRFNTDRLIESGLLA